jgi:peptidoglycan biosynthesis protein MviN/MurJ (putative lipid II flippase)
MLICHRLILSRLFGSLLDQVLANLVGVADRFFDAKAFPATVSIL